MEREKIVPNKGIVLVWFIKICPETRTEEEILKYAAGHFSWTHLGSQTQLTYMENVTSNLINIFAYFVFCFDLMKLNGSAQSYSLSSYNVLGVILIEKVERKSKFKKNEIVVSSMEKKLSFVIELFAWYFSHLKVVLNDLFLLARNIRLYL